MHCESVRLASTSGSVRAVSFRSLHGGPTPRSRRRCPSLRSLACCWRPLIGGSPGASTVRHASAGMPAQATVALAELPRARPGDLRADPTGGPFRHAKTAWCSATANACLPHERARLLPRIHGDDAGIARPGRPAHRLRRRSATAPDGLLLHRRPLRQLSADRAMSDQLNEAAHEFSE